MSLTDDLVKLGIKLTPMTKPPLGHKPRTNKYVRTESSQRHADGHHALSAKDQHALDRAAIKRVRKKVNTILLKRKGAFTEPKREDLVK